MQLELHPVVVAVAERDSIKKVAFQAMEKESFTFLIYKAIDYINEAISLSNLLLFFVP